MRQLGHWQAAAAHLARLVRHEALCRLQSTAMLIAGTSGHTLLNLPAAALAVGLVFWLLHQQAGKLKSTLAQTERQRSSFGATVVPVAVSAGMSPGKQRKGAHLPCASSLTLCASQTARLFIPLLLGLTCVPPVQLRIWMPGETRFDRQWWRVPGSCSAAASCRR